jgi:predicted transcriptional regulator
MRVYNSRRRDMSSYAKELDSISPQMDKCGLCDLPLHKKYRSHFEILALVLEAVKTDWSTSFLIMKRAGMNCRQVKKYLKSLTEIGFVETDTNGNRGRYKASEQGLEFLRQYYVLLGILLNTRSRSKITSTMDKNIIQPILQHDM